MRTAPAASSFDPAPETCTVLVSMSIPWFGSSWRRMPPSVTERRCRTLDVAAGVERAAGDDKAAAAAAVAQDEVAADRASHAGQGLDAGAGLFQRPGAGDDAGKGGVLVVEADLQEGERVGDAEHHETAAERAVGQRADGRVDAIFEQQAGAGVDPEGRILRQREIVGGDDGAPEDGRGAGIVVVAVEDQLAGAGLDESSRCR